MSPTTNTRVELTAFGSPDHFRLVHEPLPEPGPGQIRVRTLAASVQFTDVAMRLGQYPDLKEKPPLTLGYDVVGEVDAVGPGVTTVQRGDRVADLTMTGGYALTRLLQADRVVSVPQDVDPAEAVTLVLGGMTAYQLIHRHAKAQPGDTVLIHGAAGAVGQWMLKLGRLHGLRMFGTARGEHADLVASFGAIPIDYRREDFTKVLPEGFDVVFDGIGEQGFARSWSTVKKGGLLAAYGFSSPILGGTPFWKVGLWYARVPMWNLLPNGKRASFYGITHLRKADPQGFRDDLNTLFDMLSRREIRPRIAERIGLDGVADAHRRLEAGGLDGKLVIVP